MKDDECNEYLLGVDSVLRAWTVFEGLYVDREATERERRDMRIAFYMGMDWFNRRLLTMIGSDDVTALNFLQGVADELDNFAESVK